MENAPRKAASRPPLLYSNKSSQRSQHCDAVQYAMEKLQQRGCGAHGISVPVRSPQLHWGFQLNGKIRKTHERLHRENKAYSQPGPRDSLLPAVTGRSTGELVPTYTCKVLRTNAQN